MLQHDCEYDARRRGIRRSRTAFSPQSQGIMRKQIFIGVALLIMATVARPASASDILFTIGQFDWLDESVVDSSLPPGPELSIVNLASPLFPAIQGFNGGTFESFLLTPFVDPGQTLGARHFFPDQVVAAGDPRFSFGFFSFFGWVYSGYWFEECGASVCGYWV